VFLIVLRVGLRRRAAVRVDIRLGRSRPSRNRGRSPSRDQEVASTFNLVLSLGEHFLTVCQFCLMNRGYLKCKEIGIFARCE